MSCPRCLESQKNGYEFCPYCGSKIECENVSIREKYKHVAFVFGLAATFIAGIWALVDVSILGIMFGNIFSTIYGVTYTFIILIPDPYPIFKITGIALQVYFVLISIGVVACVLTTLFKTYSKIKNDHSSESIKKTPLFDVACLFAVNILFSFVMSIIILINGIEITPPSEPDNNIMAFLLLNASIYEEILTSVLLIGLPMMIILGITRKNEQPLWKYLFGGFDITPLAFVFIIISTLIFSWGHVEGWGIAKFPLVLVGGIIMKYLFVKHGLFAVVTFHFLTDFIQGLDWVLPGGLVLSGILMIVLSMMGAVIVPLFIKYGVDYLKVLGKKDFFSGELKDSE